MQVDKNSVRMFLTRLFPLQLCSVCYNNFFFYAESKILTHVDPTEGKTLDWSSG